MENQKHLKLGEFNFDDIEYRLKIVEKKIVDVLLTLETIDRDVRELKEKSDD